MKIASLAAAACVALALTWAALAAPPGPQFYGDPPDQTHPWSVHDVQRPLPKVVTPGTCSTQEQAGKPPSDAIVLFDGTDLSKWEADKPEPTPTKWVIKDGAMECVPGSGYIRTKEKLGDCQLHVEWAAPKEVKGESQGRGNSGVFLMGVEVQVLDNYNNPTYADGYASSVYGVMPPMVNALRPPGQFNSYDIVFRRPIYKDGKCVDAGHVTVFVNGVLVQDATPLEGPTGHMGRSRPQPFPESGPLKFQDHGNPVRFRNVWYRPLPPRPSEGGTDGQLSPEAATAKRKEIAASIRELAKNEAQADNPLPEMLRLAESLKYENDPATAKKVEEMVAAWTADVAKLPKDKLEGKKNDVKHVHSAFNYLTRHKILPDDFAPKADLGKLIKAQGWDKK